MTYSFQSAQCHVGLKLPFRVYCLPNWLVKRYCLLLLDVWILTKTVLISLENARRGPIRRCTNLQERVQWLHLKRFEPRRIKVGRWNELVRAKRCDAVNWDYAYCRNVACFRQLFSTSVRAWQSQGLRCGFSIRHCRCPWIMAAWFFFLHFFFVALCR